MKTPQELLTSKYDSKFGMNFMGAFTCRKCGKLKDYMDMNSKTLCKLCWLKKYLKGWDNSKFNRKGTKKNKE